MSKFEAGILVVFTIFVLGVVVDVYHDIKNPQVTKRCIIIHSGVTEVE